MALTTKNLKFYDKLFTSVRGHYSDEVPMDINEDQFVTFLNVHGRYDEVSVYYSGQNKNVNISEVIDLTTDYLVAKGFESVNGKDGVVFAFDHDFIFKRKFISMDYIIEFLEEKGYNCSWYKSEREIVLSKEKNYTNLDTSSK